MSNVSSLQTLLLSFKQETNFVDCHRRLFFIFLVLFQYHKNQIVDLASDMNICTSMDASMALQTLELTLSNCSAFFNRVHKSTSHTVLHSYGHSCIATWCLLTALYNIAQLKLFFRFFFRTFARSVSRILYLLLPATSDQDLKKSMKIIFFFFFFFGDTKNNRYCLLKFQFSCFPPYRAFHRKLQTNEFVFERKAR